MERRHIERVLTNVDWHQGRAAAILGISSKTLYRKIREYGFRRPGSQVPQSPALTTTATASTSPGS
jgi:two-component system NtrC family response regulator